MSRYDEWESLNEPIDDEPQYPGGDGAICGMCGEMCMPVFEDCGIGPFEFWGRKQVDRRMEWVSDCCHAPLSEGRKIVSRFNSGRI